MNGKTSSKLIARERRKQRIRKKIAGTADRPRLSVFRSSKHIYAQVIDDLSGRTLAAASSVDKEFTSEEGAVKHDRSRLVGELLAKRCLASNIAAVVFDRNGYPYASLRIKALAEGAREAGLNF